MSYGNERWVEVQVAHKNCITMAAAVEWCYDNLGPRGSVDGYWYRCLPSSWYEPFTRVYYFRRESDATLFVLRWT